MPIPYRIGTTILDEIERVYDDITDRAYQVGFHGSGAYTLDIEDWLTAEKQMLRKPDADLIEKHGLFIVKVDLADVEPSAVDILVTTDDVLVQSNADSPPTSHISYDPLSVADQSGRFTCNMRESEIDLDRSEADSYVMLSSRVPA